MMITTITGVLMAVCLITVSAQPHLNYHDAGNCSDTQLLADCNVRDGHDETCSTPFGPGHFHVYFNECKPLAKYPNEKQKCQQDCLTDYIRPSYCAYAEDPMNAVMVINTTLCSNTCGVGHYTITYECHLNAPVECVHRCCCKAPPCGPGGPAGEHIPHYPNLPVPCADYINTTHAGACA